MVLHLNQRKNRRQAAQFIVSDGLRTKDFFGGKEEMALPNLTKLRKTRASWGLARTELPTILFAGAYEDSA
ncbi:hypothetical protein TcasGA2_TC006995 [Tribolium castaneum]|uniref:Uncharacterized protein n=1 Tax=Tribolium castaneum TaxID=7070 RepID=D7GXN1_TRICA|nr:hypothetical protein TcasGA2_TC006995 [Tribolium castaneum]